MTHLRSDMASLLQPRPKVTSKPQPVHHPGAPMPTAKGRGKSKGKGKMVGGKSVRPPVNAYRAYYDLGGLEMQQASTGSVAAAVKEYSKSSACGMPDCSATASAAPDLAGFET